MRSARWTVVSRCAMVIVVRPARRRFIASWMSASDSGSTLDVASSSTRIAGLYTRARAIARSWRCPYEMLAPRSLSDAASPPGSASTNVVALADRTARSSAAASATPSDGSAPRRRFASTEPVKSTVSWKMMPTCRRKRSRSHSRTSTPPTSTRPCCTSYDRLRRRAHVLFPSPVAPTIATCSPGATSNEQSRRTQCSRS